MAIERHADQYFVTTADLSKSRLPARGNWLNNVIRHDFFMRAVAIIYIIGVLVIWSSGLSQALPDDMANFTQGALLGLLVALPFFLFAISRAERIREKHHIPIYRNLIFVRDFIQIVFLLLTITIIYTLVQNLQDNLQGSGVPTISFNFLSRTFGVAITEGPNPASNLGIWGELPVPDGSLLRWQTLKEIRILQPNTYTRALIVGLINTIRVVSLALVGATILGTFVGIGLLSTNWLVRNVSTIYVEIFRNTPLLVQIFFFYQLLLSVLPDGKGVLVSIFGLNLHTYLNKKGINYPLITGSDRFSWFIIPLLIGISLGIGLWRWRLRVQDQTGAPAYTLRWFLGSVVGFGLLGIALAYIAGGGPLQASQPEWITSGTGLRKVEQFQGGTRLSIEYLSLAASLIIYTSAFIADIVRAGIQSVPKGQIEAARASGLSNAQTLQYVVLPQAMRLIVPPLTNQYLNLSKNSSLALVIGYFDLYRVADVAQNQSGQAVALMIVVMISYLLLSLLISAVMNLINRGLRLKTR